MRVAIGSFLLLACAAVAPAEASKVYIVTDPITLERRTMVVEDRGPTRFYFCSLPPATSGCVEVLRRRR